MTSLSDHDTQAILSRLEEGQDAHAFVQYAITDMDIHESRFDVTAEVEKQLRYQLTHLLMDLLPHAQDIGPQGTVPLAFQLVRHESGGKQDDVTTGRDTSRAAQQRSRDARENYATHIRYDLYLRRWDDAAARRETAKAVRALVRAEASGDSRSQALVGRCAFCAGPFFGQAYHVPKPWALARVASLSPADGLAEALSFDDDPICIVDVCTKECADALHAEWAADRAMEPADGRRRTG